MLTITLSCIPDAEQFILFIYRLLSLCLWCLWQPDFGIFWANPMTRQSARKEDTPSVLVTPKKLSLQSGVVPHLIRC